MISSQCKVKGCLNKRKDMLFVGDLCLTCSNMLRSGKIKTGTSAWFAKDIVYLEVESSRILEQLREANLVIEKQNKMIEELERKE